MKKSAVPSAGMSARALPKRTVAAASRALLMLLAFLRVRRARAILIHRESKKTVSENNAWTRAILQSSYDAFIAIDADGNVLDWNLQAERTFGWTASETIGRPLDEMIIPQRHRENPRRGMKHYLTTGEGPVLNARIEIDALHRDRSEIPIELTIYPVQFGDRVVFGSFLRDITDRRRARRLEEAQLSVAKTLTGRGTLEEIIPELLENISKAMEWSASDFWIVDEGNKFLSCAHVWSSCDSIEVFSKATRRMTYAQGVGLPGRVWASSAAVWIEDVTVDSNFLRAREAAQAGLGGAMAFPIMVENSFLGVVGFYGSKPLTPDIPIMELMSDIGRRVAGFILRRQAEAKIVALNQELEQRVQERTSDLALANDRLRSANRLKDEFLATVSHELRTPLNVIQGHSELLLESRLSEEDHASVSAINRNAKAQGHIIGDLMDVSRIISGKLRIEVKTIDLRQTITNAMEAVMAAAAAKQIRVRSVFDGVAPLINGDENRLQQVIWNLLTNAVKFTPPNGEVTIGYRRDSMSAGNSDLQLYVRDTGQGIEASFLPYVFERFRQEDATITRINGGLGLGLAIARHIIEAHGATIEVASGGRDKGSEFTVTFSHAKPFTELKAPLNELSKSSLETSSAISHLSGNPLPAAKPLDGIRVLVIDDQADAHALLE